MLLNYFQMKGKHLFQGARINLLEAPGRAAINVEDICNSWSDINTGRIALMKISTEWKKPNKSEPLSLGFYKGNIVLEVERR
jgi:hypothetical protein